MEVVLQHMHLLSSGFCFCLVCLSLLPEKLFLRVAEVGGDLWTSTQLEQGHSEQPV